MLVSRQTVLKFRQYLQTMPFADLQKGLALRRPDGSLYAA